jgi:predicted PurR-regulated permease PerM
VHDVVLALVVVAMFHSTYKRLCRLLGGRRWLASGVLTFGIATLVASPLVFLTSALVQQSQAAYTSLAELLESGVPGKSAIATIATHLEQTLDKAGIQVPTEEVHALMRRAATALEENALEVGGSLLSNAFDLLLHSSVLLFVVFYLLVDIERLRDFAYKLSPLPQEEEELLSQRFSQVAKGTLMGNGVGSVAQGTLCGIAMWAAGLPSPLFGAAVMSILAFLPLVGVSLAVVPLSVYLYFTASPVTAIVFLGFCLGQAAFFENIVKTKLIGAGAAMHDLLAFLSIVGGLGVFGILGLLYGPLIATAFLTLTELYFTSYRRTLALNFIGRRG